MTVYQQTAKKQRCFSSTEVPGKKQQKARRRNAQRNGTDGLKTPGTQLATNRDTNGTRRWANSVQQNGKMIQTERNRRADDAQQNG